MSVFCGTLSSLYDYLNLPILSSQSFRLLRNHLIKNQIFFPFRDSCNVVPKEFQRQLILDVFYWCALI